MSLHEYHHRELKKIVVIKANVDKLEFQRLELIEQIKDTKNKLDVVQKTYINLLRKRPIKVATPIVRKRGRKRKNNNSCCVSKQVIDSEHELQTRFDTQTNKLLMLEKRIGYIKSGGMLNDYLLKSIPFIRTSEKIIEDYNKSTKSQEEIDIYNAQMRDVISQYKHVIFGVKLPCDPPIKILDNEEEYNTTSDNANGFAESYDRLRNFMPDRKDTYRRINHFREQLRQLQGKTRVRINDTNRINILNTIKKYRLSHTDITPQVMKTILRSLKLNQFYEHIPFLTSVFNPQYKCIDIPMHREIKLQHMFNVIEEPYEVIQKTLYTHRKNFLSYPYVTYKLCQLLDYDEYLPYLHLLKSEKLLVFQDTVWYEICKLLKWQFIKTIGSSTKK